MRQYYLACLGCVELLLTSVGKRKECHASWLRLRLLRLLLFDSSQLTCILLLCTRGGVTVAFPRYRVGVPFVRGILLLTKHCWFDVHCESLIVPAAFPELMIHISELPLNSTLHLSEHLSLAKAGKTVEVTQE